MTVAWGVAAAFPLAVWVWLLVLHGGFWRADVREDLPPAPPSPARWPHVVAVVPARDEADVLPNSLPSLLASAYPGLFEVVLVDDQSADGTAAVARRLAQAQGGAERLLVIDGAPPPAGWTGKLWAMRQGVEAAAPRAPDYLLFTDADIAWRPDALASLVARAEAASFVLTSVMVRLRCASPAERTLVPAFVFFFQMLYPFSQVNDRRSRTAAAAGGVMLVRPDALEAAGGVAAIRGALIDDCALGAALKRQGPIWLGLTERIDSLRAYETFGDIRRMVARSAYAQLRYDPLRLAGTVLGLALVYLAPVVVSLFGAPYARGVGLATWAMMALAFLPTLRLYRRSPLWCLALPAIAAFYLAFTLDSAYQYARGRGGLWKGRAQALPTDHR